MMAFTAENPLRRYAWWQTGIHAALAVALFLPTTFVFGFLVVIYDIIGQGWFGETGEGIGFIPRGFQYGFSSFSSLFLPTLLLKNSNKQTAASIFCTILVIFNIIILLTAFPKTHGLFPWLELLACVVGSIVGAVVFYSEG